LGVMHVGIDKACMDQRIAIIGDRGVWVCCTQFGRVINRDNPIALNQNAASAIMMGHILPIIDQRITRKMKRLPKKKMLCHAIGLRPKSTRVNP